MGQKANDAFQVWVASLGGCDELARRLGVVPHSVQHWYYRRGWPKTAHIEQILKMADGRLTFEDIIESTRKTKKQRSN